VSTGVPSGEALEFGVAKGGGGVKSPPLQANDAEIDVIRLTLERADHECQAWRSEAELWKAHSSEEHKLVRSLMIIIGIMMIPVAIAAAVLIELYVG
jgi:hypothetical protein